MIYLAYTSERAGLWPCARQEAADPSPWTGEWEQHLPLSAGERAARHSSLKVRDTGFPNCQTQFIMEKQNKTKQSHAKVQQRKPWKIGWAVLKHNFHPQRGLALDLKLQNWRENKQSFWN